MFQWSLYKSVILFCRILKETIRQSSNAIERIFEQHCNHRRNTVSIYPGLCMWLYMTEARYPVDIRVSMIIDGSPFYTQNLYQSEFYVNRKHYARWSENANSGSWPLSALLRCVLVWRCFCRSVYWSVAVCLRFTMFDPLFCITLFTL